MGCYRISALFEQCCRYCYRISALFEQCCRYCAMSPTTQTAPQAHSPPRCNVPLLPHSFLFGTKAIAKHYILNNQETDRSGVNEIVSESAPRSTLPPCHPPCHPTPHPATSVAADCEVGSFARPIEPSLARGSVCANARNTNDVINYAPARPSARPPATGGREDYHGTLPPTLWCCRRKLGRSVFPQSCCCHLPRVCWRVRIAAGAMMLTWGLCCNVDGAVLSTGYMCAYVDAHRSIPANPPLGGMHCYSRRM